MRLFLVVTVEEYEVSSSIIWTITLFMEIDWKRIISLY